MNPRTTRDEVALREMRKRVVEALDWGEEGVSEGLDMWLEYVTAMCAAGDVAGAGPKPVTQTVQVLTVKCFVAAVRSNAACIRVWNVFKQLEREYAEKGLTYRALSDDTRVVNAHRDAALAGKDRRLSLVALIGAMNDEGICVSEQHVEREALRCFAYDGPAVQSNTAVCGREPT